MSKVRPLNYAILKQFTDGKEYCRNDLKKILASDYSDWKAFSDKQMDDALLTACSNGLIEESHLDSDEKGNLVIYYQSNQESIDAINNYIK